MPLESTLNEVADFGARASIGRYKKPPGEMHEFGDIWRNEESFALLNHFADEVIN
jgi:hypothetical protein